MIKSREKRQTRYTDKPCDICGENARLAPLGVRQFQNPTRQYLFDMTMSDVVCENCGFVFSRQIPDESFLLDYYADTYTLFSSYQEVQPDYDLSVRLRHIERYISKGASIVEIGANTGVFCDTLRKMGYAAIGTDPLDSAEHKIANTDGTYDAVVSYYVLEHVIYPRRWLEEVRAYLKDGGIVIIEVPHFVAHPFLSLSHEHLVHFTPFHLEVLLQSAGFDVIGVDTQTPSRNFGFVMVAKLRVGQAVGRMASLQAIIPSERQRLVAESRGAYRESEKIHEQESRRIVAVVREICSRADEETHVYFWGANQCAADIATALRAEWPGEVFVVDNAASKIGSICPGFERPVRSPVFDTDDTGKKIFVLCTLSWNWQIAEQITLFGVQNVSILDVMAWDVNRPGGRLTGEPRLCIL